MDFTYDSEMRIGKIGNRIIPSVTEIVKDLVPPIQGNFDMGRAVHKATELLDKQILDIKSVDDSIIPYLMAYQKFKEETEFKPLRIEERLFHPFLMYHGQLDREGSWKLSESKVIIDIKKYHPQPSTGVQLAGYDMLLPVISRPRELYAVELKSSGDYSLHNYTNESQDHKDTFISLLNIKNWKIKYNKGK